MYEVKLLFFKMANAPSAHRGALKEESAGLTDDDIERQLAQLKTT